MTTFVSLGSRGPVTGLATPAGQKNAGNWTVTFDPNTLNCNMPYFEVCKMIVNGAVGASFTVFVDLIQWDANLVGQLNAWDPNVALPLKPGQYLYFYFSDPSSDGTPPNVTVWIRYDQDIRANAATAAGP